MSVSPSYFGLQGFSFPVVEQDVGTGTSVCDYPLQADVQSGVTYGDGTYTGTLTLPSTSNVLEGIQYGGDGTEFTGTLVEEECPEPSSTGSDHSPADVLRWAMISYGIVTDPVLETAWPCFTSIEPNTPDRVVTTFDTTGYLQARVQIAGDQIEKYGVQIRIRASSHEDGWAKGSAIIALLDRDIRRQSVTIGGSTYCIQSVHRKSSLIEIGKELQITKRHLWTINCTMTVSKIS